MKFYSLYYGRYPTKVKAKKVAEQIRSGKVKISAVYAPNGFYAHVQPKPLPDGQFGVFIKPKPR